MPDPGPVPAELAGIVKRALEEDIGAGDVTSAVLVGEEARAKALLRFRERAVVAGLPAIEAALRLLDPSAKCDLLTKEGSTAEAGAVVARLEGRARAVLSAERVALNFVARMSGIATLTDRFVRAVSPTGARIYDTRKTTPGLRALEKYAVRAGGGANHRSGLYDAILVKENHLAASGLSAAEAAARAKSGSKLPVEVEAETIADAVAAARAGADVVMLDNFDPGTAARAVSAIRGEASGAGSSAPEIEISGGVTLENVRDFAASGAERISVGALTHSARAVDVTLEVSRA